MSEWVKLFPNKSAFTVFSLYILLFVFQGVLVTASKNDDGKYNYNTTLVVFLVELLKLIMSTIIYTTKKQNKPIFEAMCENWRLLLLYFIPSLLYSIYNNLAFINLSYYDPTTYYILLQFRVVLTALIFQCLFKKTLSFIQWISLGILTVGCMVKNIDVSIAQNSSTWDNIFSIYFLSINFQNFCSCMAGTYNEYLLKNKGSDVDMFLQNVFMYLNSVFCTLAFLVLNGEVKYLFQDFQSLGNTCVILIILNNAVVGIVTSFFLKNLNSILKTYASALELIITAVVCYIIFSILITRYTIISIVLVIIAVVMYFKNPVNNVSAITNTSNDKKAIEDVV